MTHPGLLRPTFAYAAGWAEGECLGFTDRFFNDPPGLHPVEIEAGLSSTAPQAAGVAALVRSVNKNLSPARVQELILRHATRIGGGVIVPDAYATVKAALSEQK
jgi:hypothetical protein